MVLKRGNFGFKIDPFSGKDWGEFQNNTFLRTVPTNSKAFLRGLLSMWEKQILTSVIEI